MCQEHDGEDLPILQKILEVLYATEVCTSAKLNFPGNVFLHSTYARDCSLKYDNSN